MAKFKVGDIVKCIDHQGYNEPEEGKVCTVIEIDHDLDEDWVKVDGCYWWLYENQFELVRRFPMDGTQFKLGDSIRRIEPSAYLTVGQIYTPIGITERGDSVQITVGKELYYFKLECFEPVEKKEACDGWDSI